MHKKKPFQGKWHSLFFQLEMLTLKYNFEQEIRFYIAVYCCHIFWTTFVTTVDIDLFVNWVSRGCRIHCRRNNVDCYVGCYVVQCRL